MELIFIFQTIFSMDFSKEIIVPLYNKMLEKKMNSLFEIIKNWFKSRKNKKNTKKRIEDMKKNDPFIYK